MNGEKKFLLGLFTFSVCLRLIFSLSVGEDFLSPDSQDWLRIARDILTGEGYGDSWRPPLYPFFMFVLFKIFGYNILPVKIFQSILSAIIPIFVYFIGKDIFNRGVGVISSLAVAIYPYSIYYTGDILCETLLSFFIVLSLFFIVKWLRIAKLQYKIFAGVSLGLTALCKATILSFVPFLFLYGLIRSFKDKEYKPLIDMITIVGIMFLTISPWTIRNYIRYKELILITTSGHSLFHALNPLAIKQEKIPEMDLPRLPDDYRWYPKEKEKEILSKYSRIEADRIFRKEAIKWVKKNPLIFAELAARRLLHYWRLYPIVATKRNKIIAILTSGILLPLAWFGMLISIKKYWRLTIPLIFLFLGFTLSHMVFCSMIRYRVPLDPLIIVFSGYSIFTIISLLKGGKIKKWGAPIFFFRGE